MVLLKRQFVSHVLALKTSKHGRPIASLFGIPVIFSAALLKDVTLKSRFTVKTPSAILSRMI
jgi:hypothetical protein